MRKTKYPRVVVVQGKWINRPEIQQLVAEGHTVIPYEGGNLGEAPALIIHEAAHRWDDANWEANLWPAVKARLKSK